MKWMWIAVVVAVWMAPALVQAAEHDNGGAIAKQDGQAGRSKDKSDKPAEKPEASKDDNDPCQEVRPSK